MTLYRSYAFPTLVVAAVASAAAAWIHDWAVYFPEVDPVVQLVRGAMMAISAAIIVAGGSVLIARSLRQAGVLQGFPD
jgi:ABC-type thiamin/hydroxymethylpyrimidine transport system permease subunit